MLQVGSEQRSPLAGSIISAKPADMTCIAHPGPIELVIPSTITGLTQGLCSLTGNKFGSTSLPIVIQARLSNQPVTFP
jgi:hypothetical protein